MECMACGKTMVCYDDINDEIYRIDWLKCPRCGSWAEITYNKKGFKETVTWKQNKPNSDY